MKYRSKRFKYQVQGETFHYNETSSRLWASLEIRFYSSLFKTDIFF